MKILVTGGAGFIGSNFIHHVLHQAGREPGCCPDFAHYGGKRDVEVLNLDLLTYAGRPENLAGVDGSDKYTFVQADIASPDQVDSAFAGFKPDVVVHFAAESHVDRSIADGLVFARTNVVGTQVLLDAARRHAVTTFIHVSTDEVYGSRDEGSFVETDGFHAASPYSASKAGSDLIAMSHHITYGMDVRITRCTNNFGPRQHEEKLLPKVIQNARTGKKIPIYGTGLNVRDWLYVKDHCEGILKVITEGKPGEVYNIGARDEKNNLDVVGRVLAATGAGDELIEYVEDRLGHDFRYSLDDSKLRAMGWSPKVDFDTGLKLTMEFMK